MPKSIFIVLFVLLTTIKSLAQDQSAVSPIFTADSLKSGNSKDVMTSFFQLAFDNLVGNNKQFNFYSNPFAIMLKSNPNLSIDTNVLSHNFLRKLNFGFGIKVDSSYHFNGFSSGIKYSIINRRDSAISKWLRDKSYNENKNAILNKYMRTYIIRLMKEGRIDLDTEVLLIDDVNKLFDRSTKFSDLDESFRNVVKAITNENRELKYFRDLIDNDSTVNFGTIQKKHYDTLKTLLQNKVLWTAGLSDTTYSDQFFFSNILLSTEFLKGVLSPYNAINLELDIKSSQNFLNDSLFASRNLKRSIFSFEPGVNIVIKNKKSQRSFFEFKFSGSYKHIFNGIYASEKIDNIYFNGTLRFRIFNDIWVPLQFQYDPKTGNVLGFINVTTNFTGLGNLLKGSSSKNQ